MPKNANECSRPKYDLALLLYTSLDKDKTCITLSTKTSPSYNIKDIYIYYIIYINIILVYSSMY